MLYKMVRCANIDEFLETCVELRLSIIFKMSIYQSLIQFIPFVSDEINEWSDADALQHDTMQQDNTRLEVASNT